MRNWSLAFSWLRFLRPWERQVSFDLPIHVLLIVNAGSPWLSPSVRSRLASHATSNGLIKPEGRPSASIAFPQRLGQLFSPAAKGRHSSREVKKAGLCRPPLALRA
jgi:hypothetical protein